MRQTDQADDGGVESVIVLSKMDLVPSAELERRIGEIRSAGITAPVLPLSNVTGDGLAAFQDRLAALRCVLRAHACFPFWPAFPHSEIGRVSTTVSP